jgi:Putative viral replication protein.
LGEKNFGPDLFFLEYRYTIEMIAGSEVGSGSEVGVGNTGLPPLVNQARHWCFTINNYTEADVALMYEWEKLAACLTVSKEIGESGTPHLQGYIGFKAMKRLAALKKLHSKAHWEKSKSKDADIYCIKEGSELIINMNNKKQGKRNDIDNVLEMISKGAKDKELWTEHGATMVRYYKGFEESKKHLFPKRFKARYELSEFEWTNLELKKSTIIWGETGIGKTQFALAHFTNPLWVRHLDMLDQLTVDHDGIVFDDMAFNHLPRSTQIFLTDNDDEAHIHIRYKVAIIPAGMKKIFTCNTMNGEIFDLHDAAIRRRVEIVELNKQSFM